MWRRSSLFRPFSGLGAGKHGYFETDHDVPGRYGEDLQERKLILARDNPVDRILHVLGTSLLDRVVTELQAEAQGVPFAPWE